MLVVLFLIVLCLIFKIVFFSVIIVSCPGSFRDDEWHTNLETDTYQDFSLTGHCLNKELQIMLLFNIYPG